MNAQLKSSLQSEPSNGGYELKVLAYLAEHCGEVVSRQAIEKLLYGPYCVPLSAASNCIEVFIARIRRRRLNPRFEAIETVRGQGYVYIYNHKAAIATAAGE